MTLRSWLLRLFLPPLAILILLSGSLLYLFKEHFSPVVVIASTIIVILTLIYTIVAIVIYADRIRSPLQQLQDITLTIAAGDYKDSVHIEGPQEVVDLGKSLNTMSECLQENVTRLRESAVLRERMYGEYECALLLQQYMLQKVLERYHDEKMQMRALTFTSAASLHGLLLDLTKTANGDTLLSLFEAKERGFSGMYELLINPEPPSESLHVTFHNKSNELSFIAKQMPEPIIWSTARGESLILNHQPILLEKGDIVLLHNHGLLQCFPDQTRLNEWFQKVLKHFAYEGFDLFLTMLQHELTFLTRKQTVDRDIHILCIQKEVV